MLVPSFTSSSERTEVVTQLAHRKLALMLLPLLSFTKVFKVSTNVAPLYKPCASSSPSVVGLFVM